MDPLLSQLETHNIGPSINCLYAGGFLHADDIRNIVASSENLEMQVSFVSTFIKKNFSKFNISKCEIMLFSRSNKTSQLPYCEVDGAVIPVKSEAICLGCWWQGDLLASKCISKIYWESKALILLVWEDWCFSRRPKSPLYQIYY